jgi:hypothetical protein
MYGARTGVLACLRPTLQVPMLALMKALTAVLLLLSLLTACESQADKCKKACYEKVKICGPETDKMVKLDCEVKQTELAIECSHACEK